MTPSRRDALRIALIYAAFAAIWILFSDIAAEALAPDRAWLTRLSMYKGWLFVGVTALLLYALIRSTLARVEAAEAERVRLYSELAAQLRTFDTVLSACPDLFFLFDADGRCRYISRNGLDLLGLKAVAAHGRTLFELGLPPAVAASCETARLRALGSRDIVTHEIDLPGAQGALCYEILHCALPDAAGRAGGTLATVRDLSARKHDERRIRQLTELYAALSETGRAVMRVRSRAELYAQVCRIATDHGGLCFAWIGTLDAAAACVRPQVFSGTAGDYLHQLQVFPAGPDAVGPVAEAMRRGAPSVENDLLAMLGRLGLQRAAVLAGKYGLCSAGVFPLREGGCISGVLTVYATEAGFFTPERIGLLAAMAEEIGHALDGQQLAEERARAQARLAESESRYRELFEASPQPMWVVEAGTLGFLAVNQAALDAYGHARERFLQMALPDLHASAGAPSGLPDAADRESGEPARCQGLARHRCADGRPIEVEWVAHALVWSAREAWLMLVTDVTERRRAEAGLRLAAQVFEGSGEAIFIADEQQRIVSLNRACAAITGYPAAELPGQPLERLLGSDDDPDALAACLQALATGGAWKGELWSRRCDGSPYPQWLSMSAVRDPEGRTTHTVAIFTDISERKAAEARIRHLAQHDFLTGLPNRRLLEDRLQQAVAFAARRSGRVGLLFLDLDRFKIINDTCGHPVGDALLRELACRLTGVLRESDTLGRSGGDEFIVLLPGLDDPADAGRVGRKLLAAICEPVQVGEHELYVTGSVGIAVYPEDGHDAETLVRHADTAMFHAKHAGRNQCQYFTPAMNTANDARIWLENALRRVLERGELRLEFQPQVEVASGRTLGAEALLRWRHSERGEIAPADFIAVAEDCGLIVPIGAWVLESACRQAREWLDAGLPPVRLSVNVSAVQFRSPGLSASVAAALAASGLEPGWLELEITEGCLMEDATAARTTLEALRTHGVSIAIDDFGTGYSSLAYLKHFPIQRLKIDRSFVSGLPGDASDAAIARAIVHLAQSLHLETVAEGVETAAQRDFLAGLGCESAQGWLWSRALDPDAFAARLLAEASGAAGGHDPDCACGHCLSRSDHPL